MISEELLELSSQDLGEKLLELREQLTGLRFKKALQQLEGTHKLGEVKKSIAQAKTLMREYDLGIRKQKAG
ncbi:MAG: 50S ribosomal protein L29 [Candidatus Marinimicrobia bacterium]|nr:50S ribosomal protein L29 [Candidatus Neomarinimicrobiota bacterium]